MEVRYSLLYYVLLVELNSRKTMASGFINTSNNHLKTLKLLTWIHLYCCSRTVILLNTIDSLKFWSMVNFKKSKFTHILSVCQPAIRPGCVRSSCYTTKVLTSNLCHCYSNEHLFTVPRYLLLLSIHIQITNRKVSYCLRS